MITGQSLSKESIYFFAYIYSTSSQKDSLRHCSDSPRSTATNQIPSPNHTVSKETPAVASSRLNLSK